MAKWRIACDL